ncbi:MAG: hypothetical protein AAF668_00805 [Pseudomonadota bacterium]
MVKIITVHGTNAGAEEDRGDQWWQLGSEFQTKLDSKIADSVSFEPFHWSGANSERDRREAGRKLATYLQKQDEKVIVMGHSHGGSVALHALFLLARNSPRKAYDSLRSLVTIGTPMIRYSGANNPIFRFNIIGQLFLIYAVLIGTLSTSAVFLGDTLGDLSPLIGNSVLERFIDLDDSVLGRIGQLITPAILTTTVLPIIALTLYTRRSGRRNNTFARNKLWRQFKEIYAALNHTQDEAIAALKTGAKLRLTIADRRTVQSAIFTPLALILSIVLGTRTVSEIVDVEAVRTLIIPEVEEQELIDRSGFALLGIRDAGSQIKTLSGEIRTDANNRAGLARQSVVFLMNDYVVLDLATAVGAPTKEDLILYLENLRETEVSGVVDYNDDTVCSRDAIYLTLDGQQRLLDLARNLPASATAPVQSMSPTQVSALEQSDSGTSKIDGFAQRTRPKFMQVEDPVETGEKPAPRAAVVRGLSAQERRCRAADVVLLNGDSPMETLISSGALVEIADDALYSSRPELVELAASMSGLTRSSTDQADLFDSFLLYPELRRGEAIVFERSTFNDAQVACYLAEGLRFAQRFSLGLLVKPDRLKSLFGLCEQVEGELFTIYDAATTLLAEVEYYLEWGVQFVGSRIDDIRGVVETDDYLENTGTYLEFGQVRAGILSPFYFVVSVLIVSWSLAWVTSFLAAPILSGIFNQLIKSSIFGNDGHGENVEQVAPGLNFAAEQVGTLPASVEQEIDVFVKQFTSETIERLRDLISLHSLRPKGSTPLPELAETLTWRELIHTAYFDVDAFIDHTATTLSEKAGLRLTETDLGTPQYDETDEEPSIDETAAEDTAAETTRNLTTAERIVAELDDDRASGKDAPRSTRFQLEPPVESEWFARRPSDTKNRPFKL